ncbi:MAG: MEDS domain-containing protein [Syntrophaceticus sp.]|nr:MEDS domain-containing protein [Syntrophaceticus sp.]MDD3315518.1 MEDS domain-containing protein [Syntrophaceticus sp.]MDD4360045.1 MEDS domain-containing protein [Syntrophaceticus sp.]MDD4783129.1 MEDS domain-containing protein [Syntrophaceticus sp.]
MRSNLRRSGIDIIGDVPWGTHFCNFYQTRQDLLAMLVPYFTAGLDSNEFCVWVASDPLDEQEVRGAAASVIPNFDHYLANGQIEIVPYTEWYCRDGKLHLQSLFNDWIMKMEYAISQGYDGLRVSGNTAWLEQKDWVSFMEYEAVLNEMSEQQQMIILCSFALPRCRASDVIDVVNSHQFALLKRDGRWEMVETVQHKKTEQALRDSEEKFRVLTENASCGICIIQGDRICYANTEAEKITGYSEDDLLKMNLWELVHPDYRDSLQRDAVGDQIDLTRREIEILSRGGQQKWISFSYGAAIIKDKLVILGAFCDITDHKRAQETVHQQLYCAQKMEAIGQLASGLAHEINNQLTVIQASLDLYIRDDSLNFMRSKIGKAVEKASQINRQLMLLTTQKEQSREPVDINQNLRELRKVFSQMIGEDVTVHFELAEDLWMINADAANIEQVIINLILNARDAMPLGGTITIKTKNVVIEEEDPSHQVVCVAISDTGTGIADSIISQIFKPLFTTKEPGKGTGLGLAVAYSIIEAHRGWIDVQSEPGEGSTFNIYLPAANDISYMPLSRIQSADTERFCGKGEKILLVEDDQDVMTLTGKVLLENGYAVSMCRKASEALDLFERNKGDFDLVVSDLILPDERGVDLVWKLQERKPELKVLLVSGYPETRTGISKAQQQEYRFLAKPYTGSELLREVHYLICDDSEKIGALYIRGRYPWYQDAEIEMELQDKARGEN